MSVRQWRQEIATLYAVINMANIVQTLHHPYYSNLYHKNSEN
jgi:hypothetical protein